MRELILKYVNESTGIKAVELLMKIMNEINPVRFNLDEYQNVLNDLVANREIIELDVVTPQMDYRVKSIYFPLGTGFSFNTKP